jgi:carbon monoxide dehydrogenase subunit G
MAETQVDITIDKNADDVWAIIRDFGGLPKWSPGIETCRVEGDDRIIAMSGMEITEHLFRLDDDARVLVYGVTAGAPFEHHRVTITVSPEGDNSHVTWDVEVKPDEMAPMMKDMYGKGLAALKKYAES